MRPLFRPLLYCLVAYALLVSGLGTVGFVGPDEPRYADVARAMFRSGDYVTPRLFGVPWFEKPPLYYWLAALSFHFGGVSEFMARLPSALFGSAFLGFWFWFAQRFYGTRSAQFSCLMLATTVGWIGFARAAAMDMLLATTLGAALALLALWRWEQKPAGLYGFYSLLAIATLAKGPLAIALAGMVIVAYAAHSREWKLIPTLLRTPAAACFVIIAVPWYWLCYQRNGFVFIEEFFMRHNWQRLVSSEAIGHPQPFWFYVPILLAALFPWTPMAALPIAEFVRRGWRRTMENPRRAFLFYWVTVPFVFFSLAENKLPGYLLPVVPPLTLWIASFLNDPSEQARQGSQDAADPLNLTRWLIGCSAVLLLAVPFIGVLLPEALATGLREALGKALAESRSAGFGETLAGGPIPLVTWTALAGLVGLILFLLWTKRALWAAFGVVLGVAWSVLSITHYLSPELNRVASARNVAARVVSLGIPKEELAVFYIHRNQTFGLGYYLDQPLAEWSPESSSPRVSFVAARSDIRMEEIRPSARSLTLFPGQDLRLWALEATSATERHPASLAGK